MWAQNTEIFRLLVNAGADLTLNDYLGGTTILGNGEMAQILIEAGVDVDGTIGGGSYLHQAARWGRSGVARALINAGVDIEGRYEGHTPLHMAATGVPTSTILNANFPGKVETARLLIEAGADVNAKVPSTDGPTGYKGEHTPLHYVASSNFFEIDSALDMIATLIKGGADDQLRAGWYNIRPRDMATNQKIIELLDNPGAFWPVKAYAIGNVSSSNIMSTARLRCGDDKPCRISFDCADDKGNGFQKMVFGWPADRGPISPGVTTSLSASTLKGFIGATSVGETTNNVLDCALRSQERITAQVWSSTDALNANTTAYRLSENGKTHIQFYVEKIEAPQFMMVKFRCLAEKGENCEDTEFRCTDDQGQSRGTIDAGTVKRLDIYILSRVSGSDHRFPETNEAAGWYSCDVVSGNPFMVHTISFANKGGGLTFANTSALSME